MLEIQLDINIENISLGIDFAVPCGIILNELLSNAIKYAFPENFEGKKKISVTLHIQNIDEIIFSVSDSGIGLPKKLHTGKINSLGLELVKILAEGQLDGSVDIDQSAGTTFCIRFTRPPQKK